MKGLKIIPLFLFLILCTYGGLLFVESNRQEVTIKLGNYITPSTAIGFVVLTSMLVGMVICGVLFLIELMVLYMQNRKLKRKLNMLMERHQQQQAVKNGKAPTDLPTAAETARPVGRFT